MRLTRRGKLVRAAVIGLAVWALILVSTHLWWVGTDYCWGSMSKCVGL